ncbi:tripartite tricarboxylate transporter permease [Methanobacterium petrolearium]|uniref:tripartite tricarboxylate transporter permease n=1 Tax=Methanobacterium petrolearium TaxID=710190 RepID=UPI001AE7E09C|nr:tripartite tricarboxylate transporter permease [Methanobacterium petrolearium]MBP1945939.1 putative membrane protein [Methanobacterium petrolearium]BDZ69505.1 membrane protein [Methanobacterium petrolearium]BDZ72248.1 membrane protein [Methanobacterium petrolearium]
MFDLIFACIMGVLCGVVTGLIPGIHVNTVGAFVFSASPFLLYSYSPEVLAVFLLSMSISHALLEFIPSMFLGVPDEGTVLSVMPGHYLLLQGRGKEAIRLVSLGGFGAMIVTILLLPLFMVVLPPLYGILKPYIWIILSVTVVYMIHRLSRDLKSLIWSSILFIFSGIMGWIALNSPLSSSVSLLCIFSGLFGVSTLLYSLSEKSVMPEQDDHYHLEIDRDVLKGIFAGGIAGSILGFLPGMGPAQGSLLAQELSGGSDSGSEREGFLVAMSGVNASDALFSLIAIYLIGNPRSGIAVYVNQLLQGLDFNHLLIMIFSSVIAVSMSMILCIKLGDYLSRSMQKINYEKLSWFVIIFMSFLVVLFALMENANLIFIFIIYVTSIAMGLLPHYLDINKSHLMGVLIVPAIVVYTGMA